MAEDEAVKRLKVLATDCDYAAMPTKPDVVTLCGWSAAEARDDIRTILSRLEAAEARARVAAEALPDLASVIGWLENGCDPTHAATELRIYKARIDRALTAMEAAPVNGEGP